MNYGLPYKGSKSKIADQIVALFPKRKNLYDLFCGGGAISHYALMTHKFDNVYMNDVNWMCPTLFKNCLEGKYKEESRWVSRDDFERLKTTDPYVAFVWSFGNNLRDYIYGKDIEPFKKALHWVLYYQDDTLIKDFGYDMTGICSLKNMEDRYVAIKKFFKDIDNQRFTPPMRAKSADLRTTEQYQLNTNIQHYTAARRCSWNTIHGRGERIFFAFGQSPYIGRRLSRHRDFARLCNLLRHSV